MLNLAGSLSGHMAQHILLMNLAAPLLALAMAHVFPRGVATTLVPATAMQLFLLWGWHAPSVLTIATQSSALHIIMQATLLLAALWFWAAVVAVAGTSRWQSIFALMITSKLFCLLGVLLVFAPRGIYAAGSATSGHVHAAPIDMLADQQMAGLLMLVACPATYILASIVIAARWFGALEREAAAPLRIAPDG